MTEQRYQSDFSRKHRSLTTNLVGFVEFSPHLYLIFINYFKPPKYHVTYILRDKLHMSCKNNHETFFYGLKSTVTVYSTCRKLMSWTVDVIGLWLSKYAKLWLKVKCNLFFFYVHFSIQNPQTLSKETMCNKLLSYQCLLSLSSLFLFKFIDHHELQTFHVTFISHEYLRLSAN